MVLSSMVGSGMMSMRPMLTPELSVRGDHKWMVCLGLLAVAGVVAAPVRRHVCMMGLAVWDSLWGSSV